MDIEIRISTFDYALLSELEEAFPETDGAHPLTLNDGLSLMCYIEVRAGITLMPELITILASVPTGAAAALLASWIWQKLSGRAKSEKTKSTVIEINRQEVQFEKGEITRIIHEEFTKRTNNNVEERPTP